MKINIIMKRNELIDERTRLKKLIKNREHSNPLFDDLAKTSRRKKLKEVEEKIIPLVL